jgi:hypothetical protein
MVEGHPKRWIPAMKTNCYGTNLLMQRSYADSVTHCGGLVVLVRLMILRFIEFLSN